MTRWKKVNGERIQLIPVEEAMLIAEEMKERNRPTEKRPIAPADIFLLMKKKGWAVDADLPADVRPPGPEV